MKYQAVCLCILIGCVGSVQAPKSVADNQHTSSIQVPLDNRLVSFGSIDSVQIVSGEQGSCPDSMLLVEGKFCTKVKQECKVWKDPPCSASHKTGCGFARCAEYFPSECIGERVQKKFCIDKDEYTKPGETLPANNVSWTSGKAICESQHKRLCKETEWTFACEGEDMLPYTTGLTRPDGICNIDIEKGLLHNKKKVDLRVSDTSIPACVSPFGVIGMNGNVDEWSIDDHVVNPGGYKSHLKGGWWGPIRARCRPATVAHSEIYTDIQAGVRCCSDAP
jgi:sulfatase modifying factor 1